MRILAHKIFKAENSNESEHILRDRAERLAKVDALIKEEKAVLVKTFWVDKGHENGAELHNLYSNAVIRVYNKKSGKHITDMFAREGQIHRYYEAINKKAPKDILKFARKHVEKGLNYFDR